MIIQSKIRISIYLCTFKSMLFYTKTTKCTYSASVMIFVIAICKSNRLKIITKYFEADDAN